MAWPLTVIAAVLATGAFLAWDASQKGPVWQLLNRVAGRLESPHPAGRWYEFGYRHGQTHRGVCEALGIPPTAAPADLAYLLKSLGVENPPRDVFELCQRGYEDGVASSPRRYVPDGRGQDGLPESLEGL